MRVSLRSTESRSRLRQVPLEDIPIRSWAEMLAQHSDFHDLLHYRETTKYPHCQVKGASVFPLIKVNVWIYQ